MKNWQLIKTANKHVEDCLSDISFIKLIKNNASLNDLNSDYTFCIETPLGQKPAQASTGHVYNIKEELLNREWAQFDNKGLKLYEPENLLREWCKEYQTETKPHFSFCSLLAPSEFEARIKKVCNDLEVQYALSGLSGAFRLTPFVRYHRVTIYLENKVNEFAQSMNLKSVTSGENVTIIRPVDDSVFYDMRNIGETPVVSPIQLYLDLHMLGDRGKEAADHIFKEVIKPQWKKKKLTAQRKSSSRQRARFCWKYLSY